ncbi:hypothetical protein NRF20_01115 [Streptomyces sp. R-74717]|uniref:hypothetical protein n=1 Tax=Streptomyces sp. R-74717 TaxID=2969820 RepID=UPI0039B5C059
MLSLFFFEPNRIRARGAPLADRLLGDRRAGPGRRRLDAAPRPAAQVRPRE